MIKVSLLLAALAMVLLSATSTVCEELSDPYQLLERHFSAVGGLDKIKALTTSHIEGRLELVGTGLEGTFIQWTESPIKNRQEVDLGVLQQTTGDNGEYAWSVDANGKVQIRSDNETLKERRLQSLLSQYEHLNPESEEFDLRLTGMDTAFGRDCYVIELTNTINTDTMLQYYDTSSFLLTRTTAISPEGVNDTWYSDFRDVDGVLFSFKQASVSLPEGMKQVITIAGITVNQPIDPAVFEPPAADASDYSFANGKSAEDIPFQFIDDHIYLPVEMGGKTRLWVLDTGAEMTVIDEDFAREIGAHLEGQVKGRGTGNLVDVSFAILPPFSLPGLAFEEQKAAAIKIRQIFENWLGMEVVGILGYDFLSRLVTRVDYANELLSFYHPDSFSYDGDGVVLSAPISRSNIMELPVTVDDSLSGMWSLDLGAGGMSYHYEYAREHGLLTAKGVDGLGHGAGGSQPKRRLLSNSMEFAGWKVAGIEVGVPLEKGEGSFGHTALAGNIGNTLLRHFVLYLDYQRERVIVEKGDDFETIFPRDNSGMQLINVSDTLKVLFIAEGTPAQEAGFAVDDAIVAINDIEAENLGGIVAVERLLRKPPGTVLTFDITRDGKAKRLTMTLRDLFNQ